MSRNRRKHLLERPQYLFWFLFLPAGPPCSSGPGVGLRRLQGRAWLDRQDSSLPTQQPRTHTGMHREHEQAGAATSFRDLDPNELLPSSSTELPPRLDWVTVNINVNVSHFYNSNINVSHFYNKNINVSLPPFTSGAPSAHSTGRSSIP